MYTLEPEIQKALLSCFLVLVLLWQSMYKHCATIESQYLSGNRKELSPEANKDESVFQSLKPMFPHQEVWREYLLVYPIEGLGKQRQVREGSVSKTCSVSM